MSEIPVFRYEPAPTRHKEGVTDVWLVIHEGKVGPARAMKMAALSDGEAEVTIPNGEWEDVNIVDG